MSEEKIMEMKIDNLIYKLNNLAQQRKEMFDKMWALETEGEKLRVELLGLMHKKDK